MRSALVLLVLLISAAWAGPEKKRKAGKTVPVQRPARLEEHATYPRTRDEMDRTIAAIRKTPAPTDAQRALRRLKVHRYIAGVTFSDLVLDPKFTEMAKAAATVHAMIGGRPSHDPRNPGVAEAFFRKARKGAALSNLDYGERTPVECIDEWMYDTLGRNARHAGHRSWCLAMRMNKTGFGFAKRGTDLYAAMWARGLARRRPDLDAAYFPARGFMPLPYFRRDAPWSVHLNPRRFWAPRKWAVQVKVFELDAACKKTRKVPLEFIAVPTEDRGRAPTIVFRPLLPAADDLPGRRYWVEIRGLQRKASPGTIEVQMKYLVEFVGELPKKEPGRRKSQKKRTDGDIFGSQPGARR